MNGNLFKAMVGIGVAVLGALGIYDVMERRDTNEKIGMSMKELKKAGANEISASMLEKAVQEAANEQTSTFMRSVKESVVSEARTKLSDEARRAVKEASDQIQREVSERISTEAVSDVGCRAKQAHSAL